MPQTGADRFRCCRTGTDGSRKQLRHAVARCLEYVSIVLPFFGYAALIGVATMGLVGAVHGYALDRRVSLAAGGFAVFGLALYLLIVGGTDAVEPTASRVLTGDLATWFWGLTVGAGVVLPWGLTLLARQSRVALTAALFAALVGCAGWQIVVLRLGSLPGVFSRDSAF